MLARPLALALLLAAVSITAAGPQLPVAAKEKPNVVFIIVDDLNDYVGYMGGHPQTQTPHIDALAAQSFVFTNAHSNVPVCAPARASLFTGIYAHNSRNYGFAKWFENPVLANSMTLVEYFGDNGYDTLGVGKVMHHLRREQWTTFGPGPDYGPVWFDGEKKTAHPSVPRPFADIGPIDGSFAAMTAEFIKHTADRHVGWHQGKWQGGPFRYAGDDDRDPLPDESSADWAVQQLETRAANSNEKPFFLAVGFIKPHTPLHVPEKYFDRLPAEGIELPGIRKDDKSDTYYHKLFGAEFKGPRYYRTIGQSYADVDDGLRAWTRAYLAAINFADEQVGKVIDAVDDSPFRDNTIVVLTSDHGFTIGEKEYLFKNSMWESSTRVPLLVRLPERSQAILTAPVAHIDIYPTLRDLAGLHGDTRKNSRGHGIDGTSLAAYMQGDASRAPRYALTMIQADTDSAAPRDMHYSLRSESWRYIRYARGDEELYDHRTDPHEFDNLADDDAFDNVRLEMAQALNGYFE